MYSYNKKSMSFLKECHSDLQRLFLRVGKEYNTSITEGGRWDPAKQNEAFRKGLSKAKWGQSEHNKKPSKALHAMPYPVLWPKLPKEITAMTNVKDVLYQIKLYGRIYHFIGYVYKVAEEMGIKVRNGGDWDNDKDILDNSFDDLAHWELI